MAKRIKINEEFYSSSHFSVFIIFVSSKGFSFHMVGPSVISQTFLSTFRLLDIVVGPGNTQNKTFLGSQSLESSRGGK